MYSILRFGMKSIQLIPEKVRELYKITGELKQLFPERHFTPDGHLVGSLGEVLAAYYFNLELLPASTAIHDAKSACGKMVQIKATQKTSIGLRSSPEHLLVLVISPHGSFDVAFNGPGNLAWENAGKKQTNGQRKLSLSKMKILMNDVEEDQQLQMRTKRND